MAFQFAFPVLTGNHHGRGILLWLLGVQIPIIILLALFMREEDITASTLTATDVTVPVESTSSAVSWGPIVAGAFATATLTFILMLLGSGPGLPDLSNVSGESASTTTRRVLTEWVLCGKLPGHRLGLIECPKTDGAASDECVRDFRSADRRTIHMKLRLLPRSTASRGREPKVSFRPMNPITQHVRCPGLLEDKGRGLVASRPHLFLVTQPRTINALLGFSSTMEKQPMSERTSYGPVAPELQPQQDPIRA